jgi:UDPglucose--hexose-1-phosphate uridylyltransferase
MSEIRQNLATREWVIIATERANRPGEFVDPKRPLCQERPPWVETCPFCPGNEPLTEPSTLCVEEEGRWVLRAFPNKYPALCEVPDVRRTFQGIERRMSGFGVHEVVVESPRHNLTTALQSDAEVARTLFALRDRGRAMARDRRLMLTIYFKNHGASAGTSLEHPHCQMISLPVVPHHVRARLKEAVVYFDEYGSCVFCDMWRLEQEAQVRIVVDSPHFLAFVPYAAFSPFHTWILPKRHMPLFIQATEEEIEDLGRVLRATLAKLYHGVRDPDFNFVVRTAPLSEEQSRSFHWYVSLVPKVTRAAGFELGTGMFINTSLPEESAKFLREIAVPG